MELTFNAMASSGTSRQCVPIEIKQDNVLEADEFFRVELSTRDNIMLGENGNIMIRDSSSMYH